MKTILLRKWFTFFTVFALLSALFVPVVPQVTAEEAQSEIIIEDVWVPMSDGKRLAAKVYRPEAEGEYPVLLVRTPYNSGANMDGVGNSYLGDYKDVGQSFPLDDYVVVVQDVRGIADSEGESNPFKHDKRWE